MANDAQRERELLDDELTAHGDVRPPWLAVAREHPYSIAWRMGLGELFIFAWRDWWDETPRDEAAALAYFRRWGVDDAWLAWAGHFVWPAIDEHDHDAAAHRMERAGIGRHAEWEAAFNAPPEELP